MSLNIVSGPANNGAVLELAGVVRTYRTRDGHVEALAGIDLNVGKGVIQGVAELGQITADTGLRLVQQFRCCSRTAGGQQRVQGQQQIEIHSAQGSKMFIHFKSM